MLLASKYFKGDLNRLKNDIESVSRKSFSDLRDTFGNIQRKVFESGNNHSMQSLKIGAHVIDF